MMLKLILVLAVVAGVFAQYPAPPATFEASKYTKWDLKKVGDSKRGAIDIPFKAADGSNDSVNLIRLDLVGDAKTRGFAHGALLAREIAQFAGPEIDAFVVKEVMSLSFDKTKNWPEAIQKILVDVKKAGAALAPKVFRKALTWVWDTQIDYTPQYIKDEIEGIANGMCSTLGEKCDVGEWTRTLQAVNVFPELIRMACTAFGAWGKATANHDTLIQVRALDFGSGPWASNSVVMVHRGDPANSDHAFVSVAFPGFVGAITGVAQNGVGISEKVWMTYDKRSLQPGTFHGEADVFVLRDLLTFAKSKADGEAMVLKAKRTWAIWIGLGDFSTKELDLVGYKENSAIVYNDQTIGSMTGQPYIENICYVDKHPQPSGDGVNGTLPSALENFYGHIDQQATKQIIQHHESGDVHWALYDFGANQMQLAIGKTNSDGDFHACSGKDCCSSTADPHACDSLWKAYNRPTVRFDLDDLWKGI